MTTPAQPWDRLPDETDLAYETFSAYVALGWPSGPGGLPAARLLPALARRTGKDLAWLRDCLHTWHWRDRAHAYDAAVRRARDGAIADHVYDATRSTLESLQGLETVIRNEVEKAVEMSLTSEQIISPKQLASMLDLLVKTRALIEGKPTERIEVDHGINLDALSPDELVTLSGLLAKGGRSV